MAHITFGHFGAAHFAAHHFAAYHISPGGEVHFEYASVGYDICGRCGVIYPERKLKREWTGLKVCPYCFDPRHKQDFVRGVPDKQTIEGARPDPEPVYLSTNEVTAESL